MIEALANMKPDMLEMGVKQNLEISETLARQELKISEVEQKQEVFELPEKQEPEVVETFRNSGMVFRSKGQVSILAAECKNELSKVENYDAEDDKSKNDLIEAKAVEYKNSKSEVEADESKNEQAERSKEHSENLPSWAQKLLEKMDGIDKQTDRELSCNLRCPVPRGPFRALFIGPHKTGLIHQFYPLDGFVMSSETG